MAQHIGIVACSIPGAALCYETIGIEGAKLMGEWAHPEMTLHSIPMSEYTPFFGRGDWPAIAEIMLRSAEVLVRAGADFLICPTCGCYVGCALENEGGWFGSVNLRMMEVDVPGPDAPCDYDGEKVEQRIHRRITKWTPTTIS